MKKNLLLLRASEEGRISALPSSSPPLPPLQTSVYLQLLLSFLSFCLVFGCHIYIHPPLSSMHLFTNFTGLLSSTLWPTSQCVYHTCNHICMACMGYTCHQYHWSFRADPWSLNWLSFEEPFQSFRIFRFGSALQQYPILLGFYHTTLEGGPSAAVYILLSLSNSHGSQT